MRGEEEEIGGRRSLGGCSDARRLFRESDMKIKN